MERTASFPWSLEQAAQEGFGAAAWGMDDGARLWLERSEQGFEAACSRGGEALLGARWIWRGEPGSPCQLESVSGPASEALLSSGLDAAGRSARVLEVLGAMAMGPGASSSMDWDEARAAKASWLAGESPSGAPAALAWEALMAAKEWAAPKPRGGPRHG